MSVDYTPAARSQADTLSMYFSTISKPHSSFTSVIGAGTSIWNSRGALPDPVLFANSFLAALIASLSAQ